MAVPLKAVPIVVDYQRDRHQADDDRRSESSRGPQPSVLSELFVWALSAGLFLSAVYVASEMPTKAGTRQVQSAKIGAGRSALTMAEVRSEGRASATTLEASADTPKRARR